MKRLWIAVCLIMGLAVYCGYAETGVFVSVGYPYGAAIYLSDTGGSFTTEPMFLGANLITPLSLGNRNPSRLMLDTGFLYWFQARIMIYHIDFGLGVTTGIFRPSVAVGANLIKWSELGYADFRSWGSELRVRTDFRIRAFSIGLSASIPIDLFLRFATQNWPVLHSEQDELRIFTAQAAVSIGYWFGPSDVHNRK